jgi:hypothetical protein
MSYELFEKIDFTNLSDLHEICKKIKHTELVKIEYSKKNKYLRESLNFLIDINLLRINGYNILIDNLDNNSFDKVLFTKISKKSDYGQCLKEYLLNFTDKDGLYTFEPDSLYNNLSSDLRNFLISSKKIDYKNGSYIILDNSLLELVKNKEFAPSELEKILRDKKQLGDDAEKLIFKKEQEKTNQIDLSLKVDHVALRDVSAGYDIQSFDKHDDKIEKIYIEVKAVSKSNYEFHLSVKEKQTANKLKDKYFIYLLPVDKSNPDKFDYSQLLKITNVDKSIFQNKLEWKVENDGFIISKV